jgi:hypothetical protein
MGKLKKNSGIPSAGRKRNNQENLPASKLIITFRATDEA